MLLRPYPPGPHCTAVVPAAVVAVRLRAPLRHRASFRLRGVLQVRCVQQGLRVPLRGGTHAWCTCAFRREQALPLSLPLPLPHLLPPPLVTPLKTQHQLSPSCAGQAQYHYIFGQLQGKSKGPHASRCVSTGLSWLSHGSQRSMRADHGIVSAAESAGSAPGCYAHLRLCEAHCNALSACAMQRVRCSVRVPRALHYCLPCHPLTGCPRSPSLTLRCPLCRCILDICKACT